MRRNYATPDKPVSMTANELRTEQSQSIDEQIEAFFTKGGSVTELNSNTRGPEPDPRVFRITSASKQ